MATFTIRQVFNQIYAIWDLNRCLILSFQPVCWFTGQQSCMSSPAKTWRTSSPCKTSLSGGLSIKPEMIKTNISKSLQSKQGLHEKTGNIGDWLIFLGFRGGGLKSQLDKRQTSMPVTKTLTLCMGFGLSAPHAIKEGETYQKAHLLTTVSAVKCQHQLIPVKGLTGEQMFSNLQEIVSTKYLQ